MTIVHHAGKGGTRPRMVAQDAYTRRQYAQKHFTAPRREPLPRRRRRAPRAARRPGGGPDAAARREGARLALRTLAGSAPPPFGTPPDTAVVPARDA